MRLRASGTDDSTASSYSNQIVYSSSTTVGGERQTSTAWLVVNATLPTTVNGLNMTLLQPQLAAATGMIALGLSATGSSYGWDTRGTHNQTTAYDGFTLYPNAGTATGTVSVYGYNQ
tara:strand:+ start:329 stop:679 length:351 start_codon:yes stop_codon:yes gene_type:complete